MSAIINDAKLRIQKVRRGGVEIRVLRDGKPVEGAAVELRMKKHAFLFGCNGFKHGRYGDAELERRHTELFTNLLNYATLPFYWGSYEPEPHVYNEPFVGNQVKWAKENGLKTKGHPLVWQQVPPKWLTDEHDVGALLTERIERIMADYAYSVDFWDLCNETTGNDDWDTPVARWTKRYGPMNMMKLVDRIARAANPNIKMLYNEDHSKEPAFYEYMQQMRDNDVNVYGIGIQTHTHLIDWTWDELSEVMDRTATFGWPIHFTEHTMISGTIANESGKLNFGPGTVNLWSETQEDLYRQAERASDFYTMVFGHPATEALTWWDFPDHQWLRAPAGLVTDKLERKPVYDELERLIKGEWWSNEDAVTGSAGVCKSSLFFGNYDVTVKAGDKEVCVNADILKDEATRNITVNL